MQKILLTLPENFEETIASLENTKNLSNITLADYLNSLQDQEQRRMMKNKGTVEEISKQGINLILEAKVESRT